MPRPGRPTTERAKPEECTVCPEDKEQLSINSQPGAAPRGTAPG